MEISTSIDGIPMVHASCDSISSFWVVKSCLVSLSSLSRLKWLVASLGMSLFNRLHFFSSDTLSVASSATLYLITCSSSLSVFNRSPYVSSSYFSEEMPWSLYTIIPSLSSVLYTSVQIIAHSSHTLLSPKSINFPKLLFHSFSQAKLAFSRGFGQFRAK